MQKGMLASTAVKKGGGQGQGELPLSYSPQGYVGTFTDFAGTFASLALTV